MFRLQKKNYHLLKEKRKTRKKEEKQRRSRNINKLKNGELKGNKKRNLPKNKRKNKRNKFDLKSVFMQQFLLMITYILKFSLCLFINL